jgi:hypothetical protein
LDQPRAEFTLGEDQLVAVAFLVRHVGRTLEVCRHDLRCLFQWAADHGMAVLAAARTHLELYRTLWKNAAWRCRRSTGGYLPA